MNTKEEVALRKEVVSRLREVIDPEVGINIVDLGLVYQIYAEDDKLFVQITMTTPACPMRRFIEQQAISALSDLGEVKLSVVMDPVWSVEMIADHVKLFD